jgi:hypothetical protein
VSQARRRPTRSIGTASRGHPRVVRTAGPSPNGRRWHLGGRSASAVRKKSACHGPKPAFNGGIARLEFVHFLCCSPHNLLPLDRRQATRPKSAGSKKLRVFFIVFEYPVPNIRIALLKGPQKSHADLAIPVIGSRARTVVPMPGVLAISSEPFSCVSLSRIPVSPTPKLGQSTPLQLVLD